MSIFDVSLQYQFAVFFQEGLADVPEAIDQLPITVTGDGSLGLKLSGAEREDAFQLSKPGGLLPHPSVVWKAGSSIWRLVWSPIRMDLYFDAGGYAAILGQTPLPLSTVKARVARNFAQASALPARPVNRLALIVSGVASCQQGPSPQNLVARRLFSDEVIRLVADGGIRDVNGRVNRRDEWALPGTLSQTPTPSVNINKIETADATIKYRGRDEIRLLSWQFDVNTSPLDAFEKTFPPEAVEEFFNLAERWITISDKQLEEVAGA